MHVADLHHEDRAQHPTHAGQGLDGLVAAVVAQPLVDASLEHGHLAVDGGDQVAQRLDAGGEGVGQLERVEPPGTGHAPQVNVIEEQRDEQHRERQDDDCAEMVTHGVERSLL